MINLLEKIKEMLGITGNYHDALLQNYIDEVKQYLLDGGVQSEVVESTASTGAIAKGVIDLWDYGSGNGKLSPYFKERAIQLAMKSKSTGGGTEPSGGGTTNYNDLENKPQIEGIELIGDKTADELGLQLKIAEVTDEGIAFEDSVITSKVIVQEVDAENLYTNDEINDMFVKQEAGKGLSENDFTDEYRQLIDDLAYTAIAFASASATNATNEIGSTVTETAVTWSFNKEPKAQTIKFGPEVAEVLDKSIRSKTYSGKTITSNTSIVITATDERNAQASRTLNITFQPRAYWGVAQNKEIYDSADILALSGSALTSTRTRNINVNAGEGEHIIYTIPSSFGTPTFKINGFEGGFVKVGTINFTNASGYSQNYDVYKSVNPNLGSTQVVVS